MNIYLIFAFILKSDESEMRRLNNTFERQIQIYDLFIFSFEFYKHILVYHHDDKSSCARLSNLQKYGSVPGYKMFIVYATSNKTIRKRFQVAVWCINIYPIKSWKFI